MILTLGNVERLGGFLPWNRLQTEQHSKWKISVSAQGHTRRTNEGTESCPTHE